MTTGSGSSSKGKTAKPKAAAKPAGTTRARKPKAEAEAPAAEVQQPELALEILDEADEPEEFVPEPPPPPPALFALEEIAGHVMRAIVSNHKVLSIVRYNEPDKVRLAISVAPEDLGKVIGKQGRTINALRAIVKMAAAARSDTQVVVDLEGRQV